MHTLALRCLFKVAMTICEHRSPYPGFGYLEYYTSDKDLFCVVYDDVSASVYRFVDEYKERPINGTKAIDRNYVWYDRKTFLALGKDPNLKVLM